MLSIFLSLHASIESFTSIISCLSMVDGFPMVTLNSVSLSVNILLFIFMLMILLRSCFVTMAASHESVNPAVSALILQSFSILSFSRQ